MGRPARADEASHAELINLGTAKTKKAGKSAEQGRRSSGAPQSGLGRACQTGMRIQTLAQPDASSRCDARLRR